MVLERQVSELKDELEPLWDEAMMTASADVERCESELSRSVQCSFLREPVVFRIRESLLLGKCPFRVRFGAEYGTVRSFFYMQGQSEYGAFFCSKIGYLF